MTLYLATNTAMPSIPYDENNRQFNAEDIVDDEISLANVFSFPNIKFVGSDQGCGCGFRHVLLNGDAWQKSYEEPTTDNRNHEHLVDFIIKNNKNETSVQIFACWEGDHEEPIVFRDTVDIQKLLSMDFYFKERGLYTVTLLPVIG